MGKATEQRFTSAMHQLRNFFVVLGLLFIAVMAQELSWHWWFETFVLNRVHAIYAGIHLDVLIEQIPAMLVFLLLGVVSFFVFEPAPVLLSLLLAAINYGNSLGYALTFLLAGVGVVSMLTTDRNLLHLRVRPGACTPVFVGGAAVFPVHLVNDARLPRYGVALMQGKRE